MINCLRITTLHSEAAGALNCLLTPMPRGKDRLTAAWSLPPASLDPMIVCVWALLLLSSLAASTAAFLASDQQSHGHRTLLTSDVTNVFDQRLPLELRSRCAATTVEHWLHGSLRAACTAATFIAAYQLFPLRAVYTTANHEARTLSRRVLKRTSSLIGVVLGHILPIASFSKPQSRPMKQACSFPGQPPPLPPIFTPPPHADALQSFPDPPPPLPPIFTPPPHADALDSHPPLPRLLS